MLVRVLPALASLALLCLAAAGPAPMMPAPPPLFTYCQQVSETGGGSLTQFLSQGTGVSHPLPAGLSVAACSLRVVGTGWTSSELRVKELDPVTLAPDPWAIALRSGYFDPSRMNYYTTNSVPAVRFVPPIVTRSVNGVAEPPRLSTAVEVRSFVGTAALNAFFDGAGSGAMPTARTIAADGTYGPLTGAHPVIAHAICTGDDDLQQLRVAQSVRRTDDTLARGTLEFAQRFTVPEAVELRWIEVAVARGPGSSPAQSTTMPFSFAIVGIVDGAGLDRPTQPMPATMVEASLTASFFSSEPGPRWASHVDFDHTVVLLPHHDYWLYVRNAGSFQFCDRDRTGSESADFSAGIGPLYARPPSTGEWGQVAYRSLAFTIVGRPLPGVGVGAPPPTRDDIELRISPNPTRGLAEIAWSGGVGPVRLEVLDARGRRVATGAGGAAGTWRWTGGAQRGALLPAGVYFVHARDSAGRHTVERVVIVR